MPEVLRRLASWAHLVLLAAVTSCTAACSHTPPFVDASGREIPGSIAAEETWMLGGTPEAVLVRGLDRSNPVLVLLHGGPGTSETALFRAFVPRLERSYVVLYWDQPGAGRSYTDAALARPLTMERILADLDALVDQARARFGVDKVVLAGHSWGTALGVLYARDHPQKVSACVGTSQAADMVEGERRSWQFARDEARRRDARGALEALEAIGPPPHDVDAMLVSRRWVERFGGTFAGTQTTGSLIWAALRTPEATVLDLYRFGAGNRASLEALWPAFSRLDLRREVPALRVPVFFLLGRHDRVLPAGLAADYFGRLEAPCKRLVWFERAAHNAPFEAPDDWLAVLEGPVLAAARTGACPPPQPQGASR